MQRTKTNKKVDLILTADWHLRESIPICRTDDFQKAQWSKLDFISELQKKYNCDVIHAGDLFNHWKPSPYLLSKTMEHLPKQFFTIYGNHDLPQHNLDLAYKCGINTLEQSGHLSILSECHWGNLPQKNSLVIPILKKRILFWHVMTYQIKKPFPGITDAPSRTLLIKYNDYDLLVTGHNHQSFTETYEGRLLVNPGSITRQTAEQINFKPCIYLWNAESNTVSPVYLPIESGVISQEHLQNAEKRDNRINAFITRLNTDWEKSMSFEQNLESFKQVNGVEDDIMQIIYKSINIIL